MRNIIALKRALKTRQRKQVRACITGKTRKGGAEITGKRLLITGTEGWRATLRRKKEKKGARGMDQRMHHGCFQLHLHHSPLGVWLHRDVGSLVCREMHLPFWCRSLCAPLSPPHPLRPLINRPENSKTNTKEISPLEISSLWKRGFR